MTKASAYTPHAQASPNAISDLETRRVIVSMQNGLKAVQAHLKDNPIVAGSTTAVAASTSTIVSSGSSSSSTSSGGLDANQTAQLAGAVQNAHNEGVSGIGIFDAKDSSKVLQLKNIATDGTYLGVSENTSTHVVTVAANVGQIANKLATGDDNRFPTADQKAALAGTGTPTALNPYVTATGAASIEITDATKGVIQKASDGARVLMTIVFLGVDDSGNRLYGPTYTAL